MTRRTHQGFALIELIVVGCLAILTVAFAAANWEDRGAHLRLRYATIQVVWDLRRARETAAESASPQAVSFAMGASEYTVGRTEDPQRVPLPGGVTAGTSTVVSFSPRGVADTPHVVTLLIAAEGNTITIGSNGSISYSIR